MHPCRVLFICTGNSARSILCEATLNHLGQGRFEAFSAGNRPTGQVHLAAIKQLETLGLATDRLASKSWDRFVEADAPTLDIVITVCDNAVREACPMFSGDFVRSHWGLPDPAVAAPEAIEEAFRRTHQQIRRRLRDLVKLPVETMRRDELQRALDYIGTITSDDEATA
ncbi:MAG: arsenate reductase ArsC [Rhodanobacter sp.]